MGKGERGGEEAGRRRRTSSGMTLEKTWHEEKGNSRVGLH